MISLSIKFLAGTGIEDAVKEASKFAKKLDLSYAVFQFNTVSMSISANADVEQAVQDYHRESRKVKGFVVA